MKATKIINNYCYLLYGVDSPKIDISEKQYFIAISYKEAKAFYMRKPSKLLGQIIGAAMKRGTVLYIDRGKVVPLTWEKWKKTWEKIFVPKTPDKFPEPNRKRPYFSKIFHTMQQQRISPKTSKHGFERNYIVDKSMNCL